MPGLRREADIVFSRRRVAVFVDGCFWHGCPKHGVQPSVNGEYWSSKIASNKARDANTDMQLERDGWHVVRIWEHESPSAVADLVESALLASGQSDRKEEE